MAVLVRRIDPRWILPVATDSNEQLSIDHVTKHAWQGKGVGKRLLVDFFRRVYALFKHSGLAFILVDV